MSSYFENTHLKLIPLPEINTEMTYLSINATLDQSSNAKVGWFLACWETEPRHSPSFPTAILLHHLPGSQASPGAAPSTGHCCLSTHPAAPQPAAPPTRHLQTASNTWEQLSRNQIYMLIKSGNSCCLRWLRVTWLGGLGYTAEMTYFTTVSEPRLIYIKNVGQSHRNPKHLPTFPLHLGTWFGNNFGDALSLCFNCSKTTNVLPFKLNNAWKSLLLMSQLFGLRWNA